MQNGDISVPGRNQLIRVKYRSQLLNSGSPMQRDDPVSCLKRHPSKSIFYMIST